MEKDKADKVKATGVYYRLMIEHVRKVLADIKRVVPEYDPQQGYELAGFVWFQGFNDLVSDWTYDKGNQARRVRHVRATAGAVHSRCAQGSVGAEDALRDWSHGDWWREGEIRSRQPYFRQAQAAPASLPEFKGNVVAVQTAPYWDDELEALQGRDVALWGRQDAAAAECKKKNPNLTGEEYQAAKDRVLFQNGFTPEDLKRYRRGCGDLGYHYMGAAKVMSAHWQGLCRCDGGTPEDQVAGDKMRHFRKDIILTTLLLTSASSLQAATQTIENNVLSVRYDDASESFTVTEKKSGKVFLTNGRLEGGG